MTTRTEQELLKALAWIAGTDGGSADDQNAAMKRIARDAISCANAAPLSKPHCFTPDQKHPWFCAECGYPSHEPIQHA